MYNINRLLKQADEVRSQADKLKVESLKLLQMTSELAKIVVEIRDGVEKEEIKKVTSGL